MRPIGYVAATAAGLIVPLTFALPAIAGTQSNLPGGIGSIVRSVDDGVDEPDNGADDNGANEPNTGTNEPNTGDNEPDTGANEPGNGNEGDGDMYGGPGNGYEGDGDIYGGPGNGYEGGDNPNVGILASGSASTGNVSVILTLDNGGPYNEYVLDSPSMTAGCDIDNVTGATAETDRFGHLNVTGEAGNCIPGDYLVAVAQTGGAQETYYDTVTIN